MLKKISQLNVVLALADIHYTFSLNALFLPFKGLRQNIKPFFYTMYGLS